MRISILYVIYLKTLYMDINKNMQDNSLLADGDMITF